MTDAIRKHLRTSGRLLTDMADALADPTARAAELLVTCLRGGHTVYVCGDGGSAAQAQHIAGELVGRFLRERAALPCVALTTDTSVLTAIGNDYAFDEVFARQVEGLVREGDVLWALSTSGNSANVLKAVALARQRGAKVLGMAGRGGGKLGPLCDVVLCVPADGSPLVQEGHLALLHILCGMVEDALFGQGTAAGEA